MNIFYNDLMKLKNENRKRLEMIKIQTRGLFGISWFICAIPESVLSSLQWYRRIFWEWLRRLRRTVSRWRRSWGFL